MNRAERRLAALLRAVGLLDLGALLAVTMPGEWMAEIHRALGLGEMPEAPITASGEPQLKAIWVAAPPAAHRKKKRKKTPAW